MPLPSRMAWSAYIASHFESPDSCSATSEATRLNLSSFPQLATFALASVGPVGPDLSLGSWRSWQSCTQ